MSKKSLVVPQKDIVIKRREAPKLCNSLSVTNEGAKDYVIVDFLYASVTHKINSTSNQTNDLEVNVITSIAMPNEVAKHLRDALTQYLDNYAN
ncbi:hypothetical protein HMPREF2551_06475 [Neisseria sp. HMSC066H01]|uniref:hypothetical protein n=1 Tax=unclassified Neisseria TaxID=2623750 RepID=UPI0008A9D050|nr:MULTISPECIES: hypothetical protein [unclassified Neisseria]OHQ27035.1 hypothetical protein HMPREF2551_06475 [Neisseria sp. HMSC066H01]OHR12355.1 hypothetical protein HMPREF2596_00100 [Neisseria sp. HMSC078C12]